MRMGFDLDGVVADSLPQMVAEGQRIGCIPRGVVLGEIRGKLEDRFGISDDDMKRMLTREVYLRSAPVPEIVSDVRRWMDEGHDVHFVTARTEDFTPGVQATTVEWLDEHGLWIDCAGLHHVRSSKKWLFLKRAAIPIFVDDMTHVIRPMVGVVPHPFLLASEENVDAEAEGIRRWSWGEIRVEIDRLSGG